VNYQPHQAAQLRLSQLTSVQQSTKSCPWVCPGDPRRAWPRPVAVIELSAHLLPPHRPRRRWSPLQRAALEPGGGPAAARVRRLAVKVARGWSKAKPKVTKAKPGMLGWEVIPVRDRRCHQILLVARRRATRPGRRCRCWRLGLAARGLRRSGAARTRPRVVFEPNSGPGKVGIGTNVSRWVWGRRGDCWW